MRTEEAGFIKAIHLEKDADFARLVYADYLEEQDDILRAEFLRLSVELISLYEKFHREGDPYHSPHVEHIARARIRLRELCQSIPADWLVQVHRGSVDRCNFKAKKIPACPSQWEQLAETNDPLLRECEVCQERVAFCTTWEERSKHERAAWLPFI